MEFLLDQTIAKTFLKRVETSPQEVGFQYKPSGTQHSSEHQWMQVTYKEFYHRAEIVSLGLLALGIQNDDRIGILSQTRFEWVLSDIAIMGCGAVTVPIYPSSSMEETAFILEDSQIRALFVDNPRSLEKISAIKKNNPRALSNLDHIILIESLQDYSGFSNLKILTLEQLESSGRNEQSVAPGLFKKNLLNITPDHLLTICYTSGTTGTPKGAMITHENLISVIEDAYPVVTQHLTKDQDVLLTFLPLSHILGKIESMFIYPFGFKQCFAENMQTILTNLKEIQPTILFSVPRLFEKAYNGIQENLSSHSFIRKIAFNDAVRIASKYHRILRDGKTPSRLLKYEYTLVKNIIFKKVQDHFGGRLRFCLCGGAPLPAHIGEFFQAIGIEILEGYGLTETCGPITFNPPGAAHFGTVGKPLKDVEIKINEGDQEIWVKSKKVFRGYFRNPLATHEVLQNQYFKTGDIGFLDSDGYLHITDRKKDIIITSGGKNVAPQKIENMAKVLPYVNQLYVYGDRQKYLTALVTLQKPDIIRYAKDRHILFSRYEELIKNPTIRALIQENVAQLNSKLASFESIKKFMILPSEFSIETGELTPSMKYRRKVIQQKYHSELDSMYH